ncbi:MAG: CopG family transcriptional regulator [Gammaproteobacteria bacterium]|nr:CopG family transcriptional regulator [Gammaproteobacteria bacterium]
MKTIKTTVYLNAADYRTLKSLAADQKRSAAELVREAVAEYAAQATERRWPRSIGMGDSGVADLAERYEDMMDGFGAEGLAGAEDTGAAPAAEHLPSPESRDPAP